MMQANTLNKEAQNGQAMNRRRKVAANNNATNRWQMRTKMIVKRGQTGHVDVAAG